MRRHARVLQRADRAHQRRGESSVGSTNRRIESLVGREAFQDLAVERAIVSQLTSTLKTPREQLPDRIADLMQNLKTAERRIADFEAQALQQRVPALLAQGSRVGAVTLIQESLGAVRSADEVRQLVTLVRERAGSEPVVVALAGDAGGKPTVIVATNQAARDAGAKAGQLARAAAAVLGGGGGGKDDLAQGGGSDVSAIGDALTAVRQALAS